MEEPEKGMETWEHSGTHAGAKVQLAHVLCASHSAKSVV